MILNLHFFFGIVLTKNPLPFLLLKFSFLRQTACVCVLLHSRFEFIHINVSFSGKTYFMHIIIQKAKILFAFLQKFICIIKYASESNY